MPPSPLAAAACRHDVSASARRIVHASRRLGVTWGRIGEAYGMPADEAEREFGEPED